MHRISEQKKKNKKQREIIIRAIQTVSELKCNNYFEQLENDIFLMETLEK